MCISCLQDALFSMKNKRSIVQHFYANTAGSHDAPAICPRSPPATYRWLPDCQPATPFTRLSQAPARAWESSGPHTCQR